MTFPIPSPVWKRWLQRVLLGAAALALAVFLLPKVYYYYYPEQKIVTQRLCVTDIWPDSNTLLLADEDGGLYTISWDGCRLTDHTGAALSPDAFAVGDVLAVKGRNQVLYSWPMQWPSVSAMQRTGETDAEWAAQGQADYDRIAAASTGG